ncbi:hypothetical protein SAMN05444921_12182 [Streptomyces wuyuanensis]|uniref:Uncharacterized protein n=1 Tax=Streptomyces wuyuanensis TaxID=1196353 RepID=A0A1G9ZBY3_9ACTN|nr:hypothetical protein SAMN05444921_12182 [Streptomyces wuyuanensis]
MAGIRFSNHLAVLAAGLWAIGLSLTALGRRLTRTGSTR